LQHDFGAVDSIGRHRGAGGGIVGIQNPDFVPAPGSTATSAPSATIFLIGSGVAAACGSPASLSAATAIFMLPPARVRADNLTPGTGRLAADNPTIVAQFCVQVRKIAIRIRMTTTTAMALLVSVTNVRYVCS
jgi:hypothetical protein